MVLLACTRSEGRGRLSELWIFVESAKRFLLEHRRAFHDFWLNASPKTRNVYQSVANLIGGTEDDVVRLEGLIPPFRTVSAEQLFIEHRRDSR